MSIEFQNQYCSMFDHPCNVPVCWFRSSMQCSGMFDHPCNVPVCSIIHAMFRYVRSSMQCSGMFDHRGESQYRQMQPSMTLQRSQVCHQQNRQQSVHAWLLQPWRIKQLHMWHYMFLCRHIIRTGSLIYLCEHVTSKQPGSHYNVAVG